MAPLLRFNDVSRVYADEGSRVEAVRNVDFAVARGEFVAIMGPSGCGKSTLLHLAGAMDRPTHGEVWLGDEPLHRLDEEALTLVRRRHIGFVFQFFYLLPRFTLEENIGLPLLLDGIIQSSKDIDSLIEQIGLTHRRKAYPSQLSGGEMQRVAIARAIAHRPELLVADEPTGNLDSENGERILNLLSELSASRQTTILMATHSETAAARASRVFRMKDGRLA